MIDAGWRSVCNAFTEMMLDLLEISDPGMQKLVSQEMEPILRNLCRDIVYPLPPTSAPRRIKLAKGSIIITRCTDCPIHASVRFDWDDDEDICQISETGSGFDGERIRDLSVIREDCKLELEEP